MDGKKVKSQLSTLVKACPRYPEVTPTYIEKRSAKDIKVLSNWVHKGAEDALKYIEELEIELAGKRGKARNHGTAE